MTSPLLQWDANSQPVPIESPVALESRLRQLGSVCAARPTLATLTMPDGSSAHIGLGSAESVVIIHRPREEDDLTDEWISVGDESRSGGTDFFLLGDHHSEFENRSLLSIDLAIRAILDFLETGLPSTAVAWESTEF